MSITAFRAGVTARHWSEVPGEVDLFAKRGDKNLHFQFVMSAAGVGYTQVRLQITPESFEELAKKMLAADEDAAIRAFDVAMQGRIAREPELQIRTLVSASGFTWLARYAGAALRRGRARRPGPIRRPAVLAI